MHPWAAGRGLFVRGAAGAFPSRCADHWPLLEPSLRGDLGEVHVLRARLEGFNAHTILSSIPVFSLGVEFGKRMRERPRRPGLLWIDLQSGFPSPGRAVGM